MTEHHDRPDRHARSDRRLTETEAGFFGPSDADDDRIRDDEPRREAYDATAAAPAREATHGDPADRSHRERERGKEESSLDDRTTERSGGDPLFPRDQADSLRARWDAIQTEFVDQPRAAVEKANALVGDVMQRLADGFSHERTRLEGEWDRGDGVSTEDLRVALKRYRSFFDRLLSV